MLICKIIPRGSQGSTPRMDADKWIINNNKGELQFTYYNLPAVIRILHLESRIRSARDSAENPPN